MSKVISLSIALLFLKSSIYAQQYVPFPTDSAVWSGWYYEDNPNLSFISGHIYYSAFNDTAINNLQYRVVKDSSGIPIFGFREAGKRIFTRSFQYYEPFYCDTNERVVYDFNLNPGDTFKLSSCFNDTLFMRVLRTDSVADADGIFRKRYFLERPNILMGDNCDDTIKWVEGIGSYYSLFYYYVDQGSLCYGNNYMCEFYINSSLKFSFKHWIIQNNDEEGCSQIESSVLEVPGIIDDGSVGVYPNPLSGMLHIKIKSGDNEQYSFQLFNSSGQVVKRKTISTLDDQVNLSNLPDGIYLIYIVNVNASKSFRQKIIIKK